MVFPFVEGTHPVDDSLALGAAETLAAIHRGVASAWVRTTQPPPTPGRARTIGEGLLVDEDLDHWERTALPIESRVPIHGDYYGGNLFVADGRITGVIDWSDARLAPQEREVAWAVWEFCQNEAGDGLLDDRAESFLQTYLGAGGPAPVAKPFDPCPGIRSRLRTEARAWFADPQSETETSDYHDGELVAFERLRTHRLPGR
jgi:hypothetical protein